MCVMISPGGEGRGEGEADDPTGERVPIVASAGGWPEGPDGFEPVIVSTWKRQLEPRNTRITRKQNGLEKKTYSLNGRRHISIQLLFLSRIWRISRFELPDLARLRGFEARSLAAH